MADSGAHGGACCDPKCVSPRNQKRPQMITCQSVECNVFIHQECHKPLIDVKEYLNVVRYKNGNFGYYCPKCSYIEAPLPPTTKRKFFRDMLS